MIFDPVTLTRRRFAAGARGSDGRMVPGATTDSDISGSWQPTSGRDLETLPEGERVRDVHTLYTEDDVAVLDPATDQVSPDGTTFYEVRTVKVDGAEAPIPGTKAICVKLKE